MTPAQLARALEYGALVEREHLAGLAVRDAAFTHAYRVARFFGGARRARTRVVAS
ncbi:hypothetical protein GXB85_04555 [Cellulomonas sp. APG4]|uniref:hypothetical protein n=1 Tax=Cellulomonas sp. APG4 TaxID=1538656 RepID=UPI00137AD82D|nr:hypothetical protein [Cellulomonas sp. APG4]NCT90225.1 hypothetical protein [Cellulomonas sp. APG4]